MRVCDYIADFINKAGVDDVFMLSGGGMMFLTDGLACNEKINKICCHHEQAAAMAAVGYAKYKGIGAAFVTTGCGGTNTVTGVLHAWQDSTPCFFIAGECNRDQIISSRHTSLRQLGPQEADLPPIVRSITKYAVTVMEKEKIAYHMEKALYLATKGRPGPVWLSIPMDIQEADIGDGSELIHFDPTEIPLELESEGELKGDIEEIAKLLKNAERPILFAGHGLRTGGAIEELRQVAEKAFIPIVTSKLNIDCIPHSHSLYVGMAGTRGTRAANFTIQKADVIIVLGCRLSPTLTGYNYNLFAPQAKIIVIDIDEAEHRKDTVHIDKIIKADVKDVLKEILSQNIGEHREWAKQCESWKNEFPSCTPEHYNDSDGISMYAFMDVLSKNLEDDSALVSDSGQNGVVVPQGAIMNGSRQRFICGGAQGEMGFSMPGAVGVSVAKKGEVFAVTGDGSMQLNLQELQTMVHNELPVKLFVWNNDGYFSIRGHQKSVFKEHYLGVGKKSGVSFPDNKKIAEAYGIPFFRCKTIAELNCALPKIKKINGPVLCEVMCKYDEPVLGSVSTKRMPDGSRISMSIEDMSPFIDREVYESIINS